MREKALKMLGLARRARLLEVGEEPVGIACRGSHARLLMVANDAGDHTFRRANSFCRSGKPMQLRLPFTKDELGSALGCNACALCCFTDPAFAKAFLETLDASEYPPEILAELTRQTQRVQKRRQEEKAHRNNLKHGKK